MENAHCSGNIDANWCNAGTCDCGNIAGGCNTLSNGHIFCGKKNFHNTAAGPDDPVADVECQV